LVTLRNKPHSALLARIIARLPLRYILLVFFLQASFPVLALDVYFAESSEISERGRKVAERLRAQTALLLDEEVEAISSKAASALSGQSNLIVAIGTDALIEVLKGEGNAPVVGVFISNTSFNSLDFPETTRNYSAIFSDPDPEKQIALLRALYGKAASTSVISTELSSVVVELYEEAAQKYGVQVNTVDVDNIKSTSDFIKLTKTKSTLTLVKDPKLFAVLPLEKILLSSYDINKQGVIGYSRGLVKNGAAATTYSAIDTIAEAIQSMANTLDKTKQLPKSGYPAKYKVSINKHILRSLDIIAEEESVIEYKIDQILVEGSSK